MSTEQYWLGDCLSTNTGAFTKVYQLERVSDKKKFAVRFVNDEVLQQRFPLEEQKKIFAAFIEDCRRLVALSRHVNVVQHVEIYKHESERPGLVMEMMDMSLTVYHHDSSRAQQPVPLPIQIGLSHDIAQALAFLHQNGIIHQGLSVNSVFVNFDTIPVAKVGDFGMIGLYQSIELSTCATTRVDICSFGVVVAEIMTKQHTTDMQHTYINSIISHLENPLVPIVQHCLKDTPEDHPSANTLATCMSTTKQVIAYTSKQMEEQQKRLLQVQSKKLDSAGVRLQRSCDAVMDHKHNIIYLRQGTEKKLFAFHLSGKTWKQLIDCELFQCALVFFEDNLLAIGGAETDESPRSREVYKLVEDDKKSQKWENIQKPLNIARGRSTALACEFDKIIVAGGEKLNPDTNSGLESLNNVEIFKEQKWQSASALPGGLCCASGTIVKDNVCLLGGWSKHGHEQLKVYTCRLGDLIGTLNTPFTQVWSDVRISQCPVGSTTCITFRDQLLTIGGDSPKGDTAIRVYNEYTNTWNITAHLPSARYLCYAQALCNCRFLVIGGCKSNSIATGDTHIFELK